MLFFCSISYIYSVVQNFEVCSLIRDTLRRSLGHCRIDFYISDRKIRTREGGVTGNKGGVTGSKGRVTGSKGGVTGSKGGVTGSKGGVTGSKGGVTRSKDAQLEVKTIKKCKGYKTKMKPDVALFENYWKL